MMAAPPPELKSNSEEKVKKRLRGPNKQTKFPLPASHTSFDYHLKVLKGLSVASNNGTKYSLFSDVAAVAGIHTDTVSKVLKFFYDVNVLERGKRGLYKPKSEVIDYTNELEWNPSGAGHKFGKLIEQTWFSEYTAQLFKMNSEISKDDLIKQIGRYSLADQSNHVELLLLVKFLEYGRIIKITEKSGKFQWVHNIKQSAETGPQTKRSSQQQNNESKCDVSETNTVTAVSQPRALESRSHPIGEGQEVSLYNQQGSLSDIGSSCQGGLCSIQFNVSISEDTDVEKICEKILRIKQAIR